MHTAKLPTSVFVVLTAAALFVANPDCRAVTYYVSSSQGNDSNNGTSEQTPFATIEHVNGLTLQPGDQVLFRCGDTWRGTTLEITQSGSNGSPILYGSYPTADCADMPNLSGAQPVSGWSTHSGNIRVADLGAGQNSGLFPNGLNQLFQGNSRLPFGRWPNIDAGDGGYSTIDDAPNNTSIVDNELPGGIDWSGAWAHIKAIRWSITNRQVSSNSGTTINLASGTDCWAGDCQGWGYFLTNHLSTLDQEGEWFWDEATNRVYLYHADGLPTGIEGSAVQLANANDWGGIVLGNHLREEIGFVTIDNLAVTRWYQHGITTPTNLELTDNHNLIIRNCRIEDVDSIGLNLATWIWNDPDRQGWRGGRDQQIENNVIRRANHMGINTYSTDSTFTDNVVADIGLIANLGASGMGCGDGSQGFCTEFGDGIRIKIDNPTLSGFGNTFQYNLVERTGYCGFDNFGTGNTIRENIIRQACISKGDCGAIRSFGQSPLSTSPARDLTIMNNIITDTIGNTDGTEDFFRPLFGIGLYIDFWSANVTISGNTVAGSTIDGIIFQNSSGSVTNNVLFNNNTGTMQRGQLFLALNDTNVGPVTGNVFYGQNASARTISTDNENLLFGSDNNYFFNPFEDQNILVSFQVFTLDGWRGLSGMDTNSVVNDFTLEPGEDPLAELFTNETKQTQTISLGGSVYEDLDGNQVAGSFQLAPFSSRVLIPTFICAPTATLSGGETLCQGQSTTLTVTLTGTPPWDLTWSDGHIQNGVTTSPAQRTVTPNESTTYTVTTFSDSVCDGQASGSASVLVTGNDPLHITPGSTAIGLTPVQFTAQIPCSADVTSMEWRYDGNLLAQDTNPISVGDQVSVSGTLQFIANTSNMGQLTESVSVLIPQFPDVNQDLNGDGCNTEADLWFLADTWRNTSSNDPNDNGVVDVLDFLYINTDGTCAPRPDTGTLASGLHP
ncbi:putative pectate lyase C [Sulfidibacter corallicola]|uniref:Probable pectate lyase C n=1 Tax=Sulfidibacter corallicola TaxID=2818388 RepID=A0A8A4TWR2_SULCO|nr:hypothetical protein [Sulfidibacter corallicola]QTD53631.1 hypothetical protein J3U87_14350 [Sulfidibacter corallicola]